MLNYINLVSEAQWEFKLSEILTRADSRWKENWQMENQLKLVCPPQNVNEPPLTGNRKKLVTLVKNITNVQQF